MREAGNVGRVVGGVIVVSLGIGACALSFPVYTESTGNGGADGAGTSSSARTSTDTTSTTASSTTSTTTMSGTTSTSSSTGGPPTCTNPNTDCPTPPTCFEAVCNAQGDCGTVALHGSSNTCMLSSGGTGGGSNAGFCKMGVCVQCLSGADCSGSTDCETAACDPVQNICVLNAVGDGTLCGNNEHCITGVCGGCMQDGDCSNASNCQTNHCNIGNGKCEPQNKNVNDPCNTPSGNNKYCDDNQMCTVECVGTGDCTGTTCAPATCNGGQCGMGTNAGASCTGSNGARYCDNLGGCTLQCEHDGDCSGATQCETNHCSGAGQCTTPNAAEFTACSSGGDRFCDSNGNCLLQCQHDGDCSGASTCHINKCSGTFQCTTPNAAAGTSCNMGTDRFCDGNGACDIQCEQMSDCPVVACQTAVCPGGGGNCGYSNQADGTPCAGGVCNGGACVACRMDSDCTPCVKCAANHTCTGGDYALYTVEFGICDNGAANHCSDQAPAHNCECGSSGTCLRVSGEPCNANSQCAEGNCVTTGTHAHQCGLDTGATCAVNGDCASLVCTMPGLTCM